MSMCDQIPTIVEKPSHDWEVDQLTDLFHTTHKIKTQQVVKNRDHHCGDIELGSLNGHFRYPNNLDQSLNDTAADKIRRYRVIIRPGV